MMPPRDNLDNQRLEALARLGALTEALERLSENHAAAVQELRRAFAGERDERAEVERTVAEDAEALYKVSIRLADGLARIRRMAERAKRRQNNAANSPRDRR